MPYIYDIQSLVCLDSKFITIFQEIGIVLIFRK